MTTYYGIIPKNYTGTLDELLKQGNAMFPISQEDRVLQEINSSSQDLSVVVAKCSGPLDLSAIRQERNRRYVVIIHENGQTKREYHADANKEKPFTSLKQRIIQYMKDAEAGKHPEIHFTVYIVEEEAIAKLRGEKLHMVLIHSMGDIVTENPFYRAKLAEGQSVPYVAIPEQGAYRTVRRPKPDSPRLGATVEVRNPEGRGKVGGQGSLF